MHLFQMREGALAEVGTVSLEMAGFQGSQELQKLLRDQPEVLGEPLLVIDEAFSPSGESGGSIDLLALDVRANLVLILLKARPAESDSLRYAALVRTMTFDQVAAAYDGYLARRGLVKEISARQRISYFLNTDGPVHIGTVPRIILVSSDFPKELVMTALWLNEVGIDFTCLRARAFALGGTALLGFDPIVPEPHGAGYQASIRKKEQEREKSDAIRRHRDSTLGVLLSHHAVRPGDAIQLSPGIVGDGSPDDQRFRARFSANIRGEQNVIWDYDDGFYSLDGLCETLRDIHGLPLPHGPLNGYSWWRLEGHAETLTEMGENLQKKVMSNGRL